MKYILVALVLMSGSVQAETKWDQVDKNRYIGGYQDTIDGGIWFVLKNNEDGTSRVVESRVNCVLNSITAERGVHFSKPMASGQIIDHVTREEFIKHKMHKQEAKKGSLNYYLIQGTCR